MKNNTVKNFLNRLSNNIGLKIVSLIASIFLWAVVTSISDPAVPQSFYNVPVKLLNTDSITSSSRVYEVLDETDVIPRVTIRAPRSVISELDMSDIEATADVNDLSSLDTISIKITTKAYQEKILSISGSIDTVKLKIENKKSKTLAINVATIGEPAEDYIIGDTSINQNIVVIQGAESLVDSISSARAEIDVTGLTQSISTNADIKMYDADGEPVDYSKASSNIRSVGVKVGILKTATVPVTFNVDGAAASGYCATGEIGTDRDTAYICGDTSFVDSVTAIDVPKEAVNISDQKSNFITEIDITRYLPAGVSMVNSSDSKYQVTVFIEPETSKHISVSRDDIRVINVPEGYNATVSVDEGSLVEMIGLSEKVSSLNKDSIAPTVDIQSWMNEKGMTEAEEGFFNVPVTFNLPTGVRMSDSFSATLHLVKSSQGDE
ncbi:MAG: hypothetical protein K6A38_08980 [Lachnospiraceae bacterium]|nr:hypothetical protein [Lachnospiraceae bacterium]